MWTKVHLLSQAKPIVYENVKNEYTKDGLLCIYMGTVVHKYPLVNIFRVEEVYSDDVESPS